MTLVEKIEMLVANGFRVRLVLGAGEGVLQTILPEVGVIDTDWLGEFGGCTEPYRRAGAEIVYAEDDL